MAYNNRNFSVPLIPRSETGGARSSTTFPQFHVYSSGSQSLTVTDAKLSFNTFAYDSGDLWNTANNRFTAPVRGIYSFGWIISCQIGQSQLYNAVYPRVNNVGTRHRSRLFCYGGTAGGWGDFSGCAIMDISEGDYVELFGYVHGSGNSITLQAGETSFWGHLHGPHT
jgi:hypothetical protein